MQIGQTGAVPLSVVILCSGNAARSVMAGAALRSLLPDVEVMTAGTHVIEGQPMSQRTKLALDSVGLQAIGHRSRQVHPDHLRSADLVVALAPEHVRWVRVNHPDAAARTVTLRRLVRDVAEYDLDALALDRIEIEPWEEVADPAGGEQPDFDACAAEIVALVGALARALETRPEIQRVRR